MVGIAVRSLAAREVVTHTDDVLRSRITAIDHPSEHLFAVRSTSLAGGITLAKCPFLLDPLS